MSILDEIKKDSSGVLFLRDWLGEDAHTVPVEQAQARAQVCIDCPMNTHPNWWSKWVRDPIANAIRKQLEIKNKLQLSVPNEDSLHMCRCCGCCLRLKIWAPDSHIRRHTDASISEKMPGFCWIKELVAGTIK